MRLKRLYPGSVVKETAGLVMVPKPTTARIGGQSLAGQELLDWATGLVAGVLDTNDGAVPRS